MKPSRILEYNLIDEKGVRYIIIIFDFILILIPIVDRLVCFN